MNKVKVLGSNNNPPPPEATKAESEVRTMRTTKYLIPTLKPNQFDPIPITGRWEYLESKKRWICHDATPSPYREMEINEIALVDRYE